MARWEPGTPQRLQAAALDLFAARGFEQTTVAEIADACQATPEDVLQARTAATAHYPDSLDEPAQEDEDGIREWLVAGEDPGFAHAEQAADLERLFSCLDERERIVVRMRFGEDLVQREIAARLGISQMQVSRVLNQAIATLQYAGDTALA